MARPFTSADIKHVIEEHNRIEEQLAQAKAELEKYRADVQAAMDKYADGEVKRILKEIPIEEINREKQGIRVKLLREHGYNTIADIADKTARGIARINGIGSEGAALIKEIVDGIVARTKRSIKIRISADNRSKEASALVRSLAQYRRARILVEECLELQKKNKVRIEAAEADLLPVSKPIKWFFASREKKQKATDGYRLLCELLEGEYGQKADACGPALEKIDKTSAKDAWKYFESGPVQFFNTLEEINPGALGNDDTMYGLPEQLAGEIGGEKFYPEGLTCELRRYQEWGVKYILHQGRVLLGDEMGLGKTVQAIATMVSLRNTGGTHFVVVCPASVLTNWCREIKKMSDLTVWKVHGNDKEGTLQKWIDEGGVAVTTYETTAVFELPEELVIKELVVDEAHYIKNPQAKRTINVCKLCAKSEKLVFMTGTALENRVDEMISLIQILRPDLVKTVQDMAFMSTADQFREAVASVYYRRKREDVLTELPELIESREWCTMSESEEATYELSVLGGNYSEARRVSWNADNLQNSCKAVRLLELISGAEAEGRKVIVFTFFLENIKRITALLGDRCTQPITGSVSPARRQEIIDEFDKAPNGAVLVAQIQSGGTGLNIQSASVVIFCEPQFKPSIENQAISRAYRMGQTRNVFVYRLLCEDTVDEKIVAMLERKQAVFDAFADTSVAAETGEVDETTFGTMMQEEVERINAKNGKKAGD